MSFEFVFASFCLALLPGPDILFVLAQSIGRGFKAAFSVSLGLVSGLFVHTALVAVGVAALVAASPVLLKILQYLGAVYLGWLGFWAVRDAGTSAQLPASTPAAFSFFRFYCLFIRGGVRRCDAVRIWERSGIRRVAEPEMRCRAVCWQPGFWVDNGRYFLEHRVLDCVALALI